MKWLLLLFFAFMVYAIFKTGTQNDYVKETASKHMILELDKAFQDFYQEKGHYPEDKVDFAEKNIGLLDYWGQRIEIIFKEHYKSNSNSLTYTIEGNTVFYNTNSYQIFTHHPVTGEVIGNFAWVKD